MIDRAPGNDKGLTWRPVSGTELQEQQLQHVRDHLQEQAKTALSLGKEDLAREALSRKAAAQAQIAELEPQHQQLAEEEEKLGARCRRCSSG